MMFRLSSISGAALAGVCAACVFATAVAAEDVTTDIGTLDKETAEKAFPAKPPYSPYAGRNFPTRPYFGDTHTHTSYSMDAGAFGARLGPKDAYRFAKGEEVIASSGQRAKLSRPLDFLVVTDHSDGMGFFPQLIGGDPGLLATPQGRKWYDEINSGKGAQAAIDIITSFGKGQMPKGFPTPGTPAYRSAWRETIKAAEEANEPGRFTAFIGYEWTSNAGGNNLHRNIIWRDNGAKAEPRRTFHHAAAARQSKSSRSLEVDGDDRGKDRRGNSCARAQRQSEQRPHVSNHRVVQRQTDRPRICREPHCAGSRFTKPRRSRAMARPIHFFRPTTNLQTSNVGTRATST